MSGLYNKSDYRDGDLPSDVTVVQSVSLENASDSERAEKEIDRIIAEAFVSFRLSTLIASQWSKG